MAINDILGLTVDVTATTDGFVKALEKAASGAKLDLKVADPLIKSFKSAQADMKGVFAKTIADAASTGLGRAKLDKFVGKLQPLTDNIEASMKRIFKMEAHSRRSELSVEKRDRIKAMIVEERRKMAGLHSRLKLEAASVNKIIERRKEAIQEAERLAARSFSQAAEDAGASLQATFESLKSGDVGGMLKGGGKRAGAWGAGLSERGAAKGGMMGGAMQGIGKLLSAIGPVVMAVGALAAGFAAVVAVAIQADSAVKELNRNLLASGIAGADLQNQFGQLGNTLKRISKGFMEEFWFNNIWGTTAKDHLEILGAYSEAGVAFRKMAGGVANAKEEMAQLMKYTEGALAYSKLLGTSTQEISTAMGEYMTDLGVTLEGIEARFSNIGRAAMDSGFATKRFFNMVLQATSGMSMYNVRLEEAASLLRTLGSVIGQKAAGDMVQQLSKGFKDESTQDRIKKTLTTGVGFSVDVLQKDAVNASEEYQRKMSELGKTNLAARDGLNKALDDVAGKGTSGLGPEEMAKRLAKLSVEEQGKLMYQAKTVDPAMGRMLEDIIGKSQAFSGNRQGAQAARAHAGPGATLLLQLNEVRRVLKGKAIDQVDLQNEEERMAVESVTGRSGEELEKLVSVGKTIRGQHNTLTETQTQVRALLKTGSAEDANKAQKMVEAFNKANEKKGVVLSDTGDRYKAKLGVGGGVNYDASLKGKKMGDDINDLYLTAGKELLGGEDQVAEDIALAREIADNTTDISKVMEEGVEALLSRIATGVDWIKSFFGGKTGLGEEGQEAKAAASEKLGADINKAQKAMSEQRALEQKQAKDVKAHPLDLDKLKDLEATREAIKFLGTQIPLLNAQYKAVGKLTSLGGQEATVNGVLAAATASPEFQAEVDPLLTKATGVSPIARAESAKSAAQSSLPIQGKLAVADVTEKKPLWQIALEGFLGGGDDGGISAATKMQTAGVAQNTVARAGQMSWQNMLAPFGVGGGARSTGKGLSGVFSGMPGQDASVTAPKALDEALGAQHQLAKADDLALSNKEMTAEERQKKVLAKQIVDGIAKDQGRADDRKLAAEMVGMGIEAGSAEEMIQMATELRAGRIPRNVMPNRTFKDANGVERRIGDALMGSSGVTPEGKMALSKTAPAKDFVMHVGSDGRVVMAQRIDPGDTVSATRAGGAIDQATRGGGGSTAAGGAKHYYLYGIDPKDAYRALMAAGAIG